jgi:Uma2 family endonuclease
MHPHVETDEFDMLQEEACWGMAVELIAGEAVFVPPIAGPASSAQGELFGELRRWNMQQSDPGLLLQDVFVAFPDGSRPAPDICWWSAARRPEVTQGPMRSVPDLIVEVLSPSTRANDLGPKRELYLTSGVRELWLVDPPARTLTRCRPGDTPDQTLGESDTLRSEILDGFTLPLARVF